MGRGIVGVVLEVHVHLGHSTGEAGALMPVDQGALCRFQRSWRPPLVFGVHDEVDATHRY